VAFSCKARLCPSCAARRAADTAAFLVDQLLPDGLFVPQPDGALAYTPLPPPTTVDIEKLTLTIARRCTDRLAQTHERQSEGLVLDPNLIALYEALVVAVNAPVASQQTAALTGLEDTATDSPIPRKPLCANVAGFSLHAAQFAPAHDRETLERLIRYGLRPPFAQKRLSLSRDGRVVYQLRRPWPKEGGATHLLLDPLDFLRRLAALLPAPFAHGVRYHGLC
jgi:hypothetical protein